MHFYCLLDLRNLLSKFYAFYCILGLTSNSYLLTNLCNLVNILDTNCSLYFIYPSARRNKFLFVIRKMYTKLIIIYYIQIFYLEIKLSVNLKKNTK